MLKVRWFFALLWLALLLVLPQVIWAEDVPDQQSQAILQRLSEGAPAGQQVSPVVETGFKGGGDLIWWYQGIENVVCVSEFVDVDGDALPDVLMESYDSGAPVADHFFCIKGNSPGYGTVLWSCRPLGGPSNSGGYGDQCVSYIEDVNGDGHVDALLGTAWGSRTAFAINGITGATIWSYDTYVHTPSGWIYSICPITDLTGDGIDDVIFAAGSDADAAYCVNGTNGNLIWKFQANDAVMSICQIEDMNSDGYADAVIAGGDDEHRLICLSGHSTGSPSIIWQFTSTAGFWDVSTIQDVNGDGYDDVLAGGYSSYTVYCRNGRTGAHIWSYYVGSGEVVMRVEPIADIDDDGIQDVLVASWKNAIICLSGFDGSLICSYTVGTTNGGDVWAVDPIDDVNGDGYPEALGGSFDYYVYCVDVKACSLLWKYYTGNRLYTVRGLPDVNGDNVPDALAGTQMLTTGGKAYCISGGVPQNIVPHVLSISPSQNHLNVPVNTNITARFDVDMMPSSINESTFVVNAWSTGLHQGTITYNSQTRLATLDPSENFDEGEIATVVLTTGIKSSVGTPMESSYVWTFTTKVDDGAACFTPPFNYGAGDYPISVFCADLDGDGHLDLAVANWPDSVSILMNNGDGTFPTRVGYGVGVDPWSVFCADLDGDGDLDLAVVNNISDSVSILKNNGDGTFQSATNYEVGREPRSVFCADLDGDGDLDLAVVNFGSDSVSILMNNGHGTFQSVNSYAAGRGPNSVFCADLDSDGDLELAVANYSSDSVTILDNDGHGAFQNATNYKVGHGPWFIFCADLDGDGHLDLAVTNSSSDSVSILKNNGHGTFYLDGNYAVGDDPRSVFCADLDGDGDLDLAVANNISNSVSILKNNGDGTFQTRVDYGVGLDPWSVFCADLDGDGDLDLAVANDSSNYVSILLNIRRGDCNGDKLINVTDVVFLINHLFINGPAPAPLPVGDVNCDGVINIVDVVYLINYLFIDGPSPCC